MSIGNAIPAEYEFTPPQNQMIGDLARKMALVGFVIMFFGGLQMFNGIMSLIAFRNPDRVIAAAKEHGMPEVNLKQLEQALTAQGWLSPAAVSALAFGLSGLFMFLVGLWTQQAAGGFAAIVRTKGQDISRLMDALGALHKKYHLMYTLIWIAVICSLLSLVFSLFHVWSGK